MLITLRSLPLLKVVLNVCHTLSSIICVKIFHFSMFSVTVHVLGMQGAMKMLHSRIQVITEYLKKVKEGSIPFDHEIMRKIGVLHDLLGAAQSPDFDKRFFVEYNDEMLLAYLSSLTEGLQTMNTMVDAHCASSAVDRDSRATDISMFSFKK